MEIESKRRLSRKNISLILKILTIISSFVGIICSFVFASEEGYSSWYIRGAYFTLQSNFWIGGIMLYMVIAPLIKGKINYNVVYFFKFIFTVSITLTFIVFWTLLAPFAYMQNYNPWSISSFTTHLLAPALAIIDFFVDEKQTIITKKQVFSGLLPPLFYFVFASVLILFRVDFGRGDLYPYFFMDFFSSAGWFGYIKEPFVLGTGYYLIFISGVVLGVSALLSVAHSLLLKFIKKQKND